MDRSKAGRTLVVLVVAIAIGCFFSAIIPPFQSPDEFDHVKRAYGLRSGQILLSTLPGRNSGLWVDDGLLSFMKPYQSLPLRPGAKVSAGMIEEGEAARWTGTRSFSGAPGTGYYFPLVYLPQTLGLLAGECLGWTVANSYRLARLMVLLTSVALLLLAFSVFPTNFFTLALLFLPMTLFQLSSASLDAVTTALTILCVSLFMRGANAQAAFPRWMEIALGGTTLILAMCRVHLIGLTLLPFFLYFVRRDRIQVLLGSGAIAVATAWTVVALLTTRDVRTNGPEQAVLPIALYYLGHPGQFVEVLWATVSSLPILGRLMRQFVGILGWLDTLLPSWFYGFAAAPLIVTFGLSVSTTTLKEDAPARGALLAVSLVAVFLVFALLLLAGTRHPATVILGVQGRYFLLPLILIGYAAQGNANLLRTSRRYAGYPVLALWAAMAIYVAADALRHRYY